ncbi:MAG: type IV secretion system DNA-binding domain-containing protein [Cyanobacteria bacterium P01_A01_bin.84]
MKAKNNNLNGVLIATIISLIVLLLFWWAINNKEVALFLIEHPIVILPYIVDKIGYPRLILGGIFISLISSLLFIRPDNKINERNRNVVRGAMVIPKRKLKAILNKQSKATERIERKKTQLPQLEIGGIPIPNDYERLGFFTFGSPGTGKTQTISQMIATLRNRRDFRGIIFDRSGEMLEKFYDPTRDIIFNPFDVRSVGWSHVNESARLETMAKGLIPLESEREPFFSNAARVIIAELFHQTKSNQELWSLLISDTKAIHSFVAETLAARYTGEEKSAASVLSTVSNYCQFYKYLTETEKQSQNQKQNISFYDWGRRDCSNWIFITIEENDAELLKPLHTLAFELMLRGLLSNKHRQMKTAIIIDELGALNKLPGLSDLMSEGRKFGGCPILGTQTQAQLTKIYGSEDTATILQGTQTKLILKSVDHETANLMADIIGKQEIKSITENYSRSRRGGRNGNGRTDGFNEQFREVYAVMPDEIKSLPKLSGYLKIDKYCAPVQLKGKNFPPCARSFVPLQDHKPQSIQEQWGDWSE